MRIRKTMAMALMGVCMGLASPAWAADSAPTSGDGEIAAKDVQGKTVSIGDHLYRVTPMTVILDQEGRRIKLRKLPVPNVGADEGDREMISGEFEAVEVRGEMVLESLTLVDTPQ